MALALSTGTAQTSAGASLTPLYRPAASYVCSRDVPGEALFVNSAGALDQPNTVRFAVQTISDLFKGSDLTPSEYQTRSGLSMLAQVAEVWKVDDAADALASLYYPASAHIVVKVPNDALVTSTVVADLVRRLLGAVLLDNDDTLAQGWNNLLHSITRF